MYVINIQYLLNLNTTVLDVESAAFEDRSTLQSDILSSALIILLLNFPQD